MASVKIPIRPAFNKQTIDDRTYISPAIAVTDDELACFHAVRHSLRSHKTLTDDDIGYAANYITSFYVHSNDVKSSFTEEQLITFLVYSNQNEICKFALTFNDELNSIIKRRDSISLGNLLLGNHTGRKFVGSDLRGMFVELYDNRFLVDDDKEFIIRLISREMFATKLSLGLLRKKILNFDNIDDRCASETLDISTNQTNASVQMTSLVTKCYDEVCIQDAKILSDDGARATMSKYEKAPPKIYTVDKPRNALNPQVYCFDTLELINAVVTNSVNPKSGEPFSGYALDLINRRFRKEISMYRRYKQ